MSTSIDEQVVRMRFDNRDFEKKANSTIGVLEKLKSKLTFKESAKALDDFQKSANSLNFNSMNRSAEDLSVTLSTKVIAKLEIMRNLVSRVTDAGVNMVKSLSIDQVSSGFGKYEQKLANTQAIMNATKKPLDEVNKQLDKLMWYTDETSYSFTDMANTIGRFTAYNIPLETSVTSIIGIANAAGLAGASIQDASHAMQGFAKGIGSAMDTADWQWIETAHMDTAEFKKQLLESGVAMGKLKKVGDGTYKTLKGTLVNIESFRSSISEKWITGDVLTDTLGKFGQYSEEVYKLTQQGMATADAMDLLSGKFDEVGEAGMRASQESKTFGDALSAVKDAISSGWMVTFETLFGNFEEAKEVWAALYDELYDIFALSGETRNELLSGWKESGGRDILFETIAESWQKVKDIVGEAKKAFREMFPSATVDNLIDITNGLKDFIDKCKLSEDAMYSLKVIFKTLLLPLKLLANAVKIAGAGLEYLLLSAIKLSDILLTMASNTEYARDIFKKAFGNEKGERIFNALSQIITNFITKIDELIVKAKEFKESLFGGKGFDLSGSKKALKEFGDVATEIFASLLEGIATGDWTNFFNVIQEGFKGIRDTAVGVGNAIGEFFNNLLNFFGIKLPDFSEIGGFKDFVQLIKDFGESLNPFADGIDKIKEKGSGLLGILKNIGSAIIDFTNQLSPAEIIISGVGIAIVTLIFQISNWVGAMAEITKGFKAVTKSAGAMFDAIKNRLDPTFKKAKTIGDSAVKIGAAFILLATALKAIAQIPADDLKNAADAMAILIGVIAGAAAILSVINIVSSKLKATTETLSVISTTIIALSISMIAFAGAMRLLQNVKFNDDMIKAWAAVLTSLAGLAIAAGYLGSKKNEFQKGSSMILSMAASFYIIVKAINALDPEKVADGIGLMIGMCGSLSILFLAVSGVGEDSAKALKSIKSIAFGLILLIGAIELMGWVVDKDPEHLISGFGMMIGVFVVLGAFLGIVGHVAEYAKESSKAIGRISRALLLLVPVIWLFGTIKEEKLKQGLGAIAGLLGMFIVLELLLGIINRLFGNTTGSFSKSIMNMAIAIDLLVLAVAALGYLDLKAVAQGTIAVGALMLFMGGMLRLAKVSKEATISIGTLAAAIGMFAAAVAGLSFVAKYNKEGFWSAVIAMVAGLTGICIAMKVLQKEAKGLKKVIAVIGIMATIVGAIIAVSVFLKDMDADDVIKKFGSLAGIMIAMGVFVKIVDGFGKDIKKINWPQLETQMIEMLGACSIATGAVWILGNMEGDPEKAKDNAVALGIVLTTTAAAIKIFNNTKWDKDLGNKAGWMLTFIIVAGTAVGILGNIGGEAEKAIGNAVAMGIVIDMTALAVAILNRTKFDTAWQAALAMGGLILAVSSAMWILGQVPTDGMLEKTKSIILILGGLTAIVEILSHFKVDPTAVLSGLASIGEVLLAVAGVIFILGAIGAIINNLNNIDENFDVKAQIEDAFDTILDIIQVITDGVARIVGSFVDTIGDTATKTLTDIGNRIGTFIETVGTAIATVNAVDSTTPEKFGYMINCVNQIFDALNHKGARRIGDLPDITQKIYDFSVQWKDIASNFSEAYNTKVGSVVGNFKSLAEGIGEIPVGRDMPNLTKFGKQINDFAPYLKTFVEAISESNISTATVTSATDAARSIANFAAEIGQNGVAAAMGLYADGNGLLGKFGTELNTFGPSLKTFVSDVKDVSTADVEGAANAAGIIAKFADGLPKENGFVQMWAGETKALSTFGAELIRFGPGLKTFSLKAKEVDKDAVQNAADAAKIITTVYSELPTEGGWLKWLFAGDTISLDNFAAGIIDLGQALINFNNAGVDTSNVQKAVDATQLIVDLSNNLDQFNENNIDWFVNDIKSFATDGIINFVDEIENSESVIKDAGVLFAEYAIDGINSQLDALGTAASSMVSTMCTSIRTAAKGDSLKSAGKYVATMSSKALKDNKLFNNAGADMLNEIIKGIKSKVEDFKNEIREILKAALSVFNEVNKNNAAYSNTYFELGIKTLDGYTSGMKSREKNLLDTTSKLIINYKKKWTELEKEAKKIGSNFFDGIIKGMKEKQKDLNKVASDSASTVLAIMRKVYKIHSPSIEGEDIGKLLMQGKARGISKDTSAKRAAMSKSLEVLDGLQNGVKNNRNKVNLANLLNFKGINYFKKGETDGEQYAKGMTKGLKPLQNFIKNLGAKTAAPTFVVNNTAKNLPISEDTTKYVNSMTSAFEKYLEVSNNADDRLKEFDKDSNKLSNDLNKASLRTSIANSGSYKAIVEFEKKVETINGLNMIMRQANSDDKDYISKLTDKLNDQTKQAEEAKTDFLNTVQKYGKDSKEAVEAFNTWSVNRSAIASIQNQITSITLGKYDEFAELFLKESEVTTKEYTKNLTNAESALLTQAQQDMALYQNAVGESNDEVLNMVEKLRKDIADGIINDNDIINAIQDKMSDILGIFSDIASDIDLNFGIEDKEYQLWEKTEGLNATEREKLLKQQELQEKNIAAAATKVRVQEMAYNKAVQLMGSNSTEARQEYEKLIDIQTEFAEISAQYAETLTKLETAQEDAIDTTKTPYELAMEELEEWKKDGSFKEWTDFGATEQELIDALIDKYEKKAKEAQKNEEKKAKEETVKWEKVKEIMNNALGGVNMQSLNQMVHDNMTYLVKAWAQEYKRDQNGGTYGYEGSLGTSDYGGTGATAVGTSSGGQQELKIEDKERAIIKLVNTVTGEIKELLMTEEEATKFRKGLVSGWKVNMTNEEYKAAWRQAAYDYQTRNTQLMNNADFYENVLASPAAMLAWESYLSDIQNSMPTINKAIEVLSNAKDYASKIGETGNLMDMSSSASRITKQELQKAGITMQQITSMIKWMDAHELPTGIDAGSTVEDYLDVLKGVQQMAGARKVTAEELSSYHAYDKFTQDATTYTQRQTFGFGGNFYNDKGQIAMIGPDGYWYMVPISQFRDYLSQGYKYYQGDKATERHYLREDAQYTAMDMLNTNEDLANAFLQIAEQQGGEAAVQFLEGLASGLEQWDYGDHQEYLPMTPNQLGNFLTEYHNSMQEATSDAVYNGVTSGTTSALQALGGVGSYDYTSEYKKAQEDAQKAIEEASGGTEDLIGEMIPEQFRDAYDAYKKKGIGGILDYGVDWFGGKSDQLSKETIDGIKNKTHQANVTVEDQLLTGSERRERDKTFKKIGNDAGKSATIGAEEALLTGSERMNSINQNAGKQNGDAYITGYIGQIEAREPDIVAALSSIIQEQVAAALASQENSSGGAASGSSGVVVRANITPVIEMGDANKDKTIVPTESTSNIREISKEIIKRIKEAQETRSSGDQESASSNTVVNNFTQNNYSPKALSAFDIYRQTKNQISRMKGGSTTA